jgi:alpha/beta superfamily hydrolase
VARELEYDVTSVDYRGIDDPPARVQKLIETASGAGAPRSAAPGAGALRASPVLVGSSMGGYVCAAAAAMLRPRALFLLAPAFYMPGLEQYTPHDVQAPTTIVHGWHDDIVPVENSVRWAREHRSTLHVLDSNHRLENQIGTICILLREFLKALR